MIDIALPNVQPGWSIHLNRLRSVGARRDTPSAAYAALKGNLSRGSVLLDVGCGESRDRLIASSRGVIAFGVDLFAPASRSTDGFICADARRLPFAASSVDAVICQAVIALIPPDDRRTVYSEIARVLKPNGWFAAAVYSLTDGWHVSAQEEAERVTSSGFARVRAGLYQKENVMSEALVPVSKESQSSVHLVARNPVEMQNAQADLSVWLKNKLTETAIEIQEMNNALGEAQSNGWATAPLTRQRNKALGQQHWYFKILTAVEAGYTIVPEFPIEVFAIRVTRGSVRAKDATSTSTWGYPNIDNERPDIAPVGEGDYKNPVQLVRHYEYPEKRVEQDVTVRCTQAAEFQEEVVFPLRAARPGVMNATSQAMALKVFDQIGICLPTRNAGTSTRSPDPLIIGQILGKRKGWSQKCASFIIAWHLDLRTL